MSDNNIWIKQLLTELRKLDRVSQRTRLEQVLDSITEDQREALRQEIQARQARVQAEARTYQTRRQGDTVRKIAQKEVMLARYSWLLHIMQQYNAE